MLYVTRTFHTIQRRDENLISALDGLCLDGFSLGHRIERSSILRRHLPSTQIKRDAGAKITKITFEPLSRCGLHLPSVVSRTRKPRYDDATQYLAPKSGAITRDEPQYSTHVRDARVARRTRSKDTFAHAYTHTSRIRRTQCPCSGR
jgi:hypothetical protein